MSLSKQLLLFITAIFLVIFTISFLVSLGNIKSYLEGEAEIHVQDTATSLGLSLSPYMMDENDPILRTMMNSIFDTGYYKEMRLVNVDGDDLITLSNPVKLEGVPQWLVNSFPMETATAVSEISSGWNITGTLYLTGNPGYGYLKLYEQMIQTFISAVFVLILAVLLLLFVLRFTLKPLKEIEQQANEISAGNFTLIEKMPVTSDVKTVAMAMNSMSSKIGLIVKNLNSRLEQLSDGVKRDGLTRLYNQETFENDFKQTLLNGEVGYVLYIKFDDLQFLSKEKGNDEVDNLLVEFANVLNHFNGTTAYRIYGAEFVLMCMRFDQQQVTDLAKTLAAVLTGLGQNLSMPDLAHLGAVKFDRSSEFDRLSPAMLEAYEQAKQIGSNAFYIKQDCMGSLSPQQWKSIILNTISNDKAEVAFTNPAYHFSEKEQEKVMEEAFSIVTDDDQNILPVGTFVSMAQEFDLSEEMDRYLVDKVLKRMDEEQYKTPMTINLSIGSVSSLTFYSWLLARVDQSKTNSNLLVFAVSAYAANKHLTVFENFCRFVKSINANVMLKRYDADIISVDRLKRLQVDYIRLSRNMTTGISHDLIKPDFLVFINELTQILDIKIITEQVDDDDDFEIIKNASIYGIGR
jgi:EAL domain-containing protein (putative c-di-GMP-specific phosphodiesterase class I)/GGDEF domain-containing protein